MIMNDMFSFEETPWELFSGKLNQGDVVSASRFLTLLEGESEDTLEDAFRTLEALRITLDISDLPRPTVSGEAGKRLALEEKLVKQGNLLTGLSEGDPLRLYLEELAGIPAFGDVQMLALELAEANRANLTDSPVQMQLVNLSLSRVIELAGDFSGRGVLLMDLIQEASLGLWQGILVYTGEENFEVMRDWWIRQYMTRAVVLQARENGVGGKLRQALEAYQKADKTLLTRLGRNPGLEEIALELNMTVEDAAVLEKMLADARIVAKAKQAQQPPQEDPEDEQHVEDTAYFQMRQRIQELLSVLEEDDAKILSLRFGLEGGLPLSQQDTARKLNMSTEEVTAREVAALAKLRSET